jgi:proline racemase
MRFSKVMNVVGCHVGGEVGNVVVGGVGDVPGETMFEKRLYLERERDDIRQLLLKEPRGSMIRSANVVLPSTHPEACARREVSCPTAERG